jgi:hypothetical protein
MKKIFIFMVFIFVNLYGKSYVIDCDHTISGKDVGGRFETKAQFRAKEPTFIEWIKIKLEGKRPDSSKNIFLTSKSVCGLDIDFHKSCTSKERIDKKLGYEFTFTCGNDITDGQIYCDEDCLTNNAGGLTFKCEGPKVDKKFSGAGRIYQGCTVTEAI